MCLHLSSPLQLEKLAELLQKESKIRDGAEVLLQVPNKVRKLETLLVSSGRPVYISRSHLIPLTGIHPTEDRSRIRER
jgi:hypothetical protein